MPQYAWLELNGGMWHLLTGIRAKPNDISRTWADKNAALEELRQEGWTVSGPYPNQLSRKLNISPKFHGYGLIRTVH